MTESLLIHPCAIGVATLHTPEVADYAAVAERNLARYCRRHGYPLFVERRSLDPSRHPAWGKVKLLRSLLVSRAIDFVLWVDADAFVNNPDRHIEEIIVRGGEADLVISPDDNGPNSGVFLMRRSAAAVRFLDDVWACPDHHWSDWWEQSAMQDLLRADPGRLAVREVPRGEFHTMYNQTSPRPVTAADFIVHFPGAWGKADLMRRYCPAVDHTPTPPP